MILVDDDPFPSSILTRQSKPFSTRPSSAPAEVPPYGPCPLFYSPALFERRSEAFGYPRGPRVGPSGEPDGTAFRAVLDGEAVGVAEAQLLHVGVVARGG